MIAFATVFYRKIKRDCRPRISCEVGEHVRYWHKADMA